MSEATNEPCPYSVGTPPPTPLSIREAEVAWLISEDLKDEQIAKCLGIALRTANTHRDHILRKLKDGNFKVRSRVGIGVWIVKKYHGLLSVAVFSQL